MTRWLVALLVGGLLLSAGCSDKATKSIPPARLQSVSVVPATQVVASSLSLQVKVSDASGAPLADVPVAWAEVGGGSVGASTTLSGSDGIAQVAWTMGSAAGPQTVVASAAGLAPVLFQVTTIPGPAAQLRITPDSAVLTAIGDTTILRASIADAYGNAIAAAQPVWTSLDTTVAVADSGVVRARGNGTARIVAALSGGPTDTVSVHVAQQLVTIRIAPDSVLLNALGDTAAFQVVVRDRNGNTVAAPVVGWFNLDTAVTRLDTEGRVVSQRVGRGRIVAVSGSAADTATVIARQVAASVRITPPSDTLLVSDTVTLKAIATDSNGVAIPGAAFTWTASAPTVQVGPGGVMVGAAAGPATVAAAVDGVSGAAAVTVRDLALNGCVARRYFPRSGVTGTVSTRSCRVSNPPAYPGAVYYADAYWFRLASPTSLTIEMGSAGVLDSFLSVYDAATGALVVDNDDAVGHNSRLSHAYAPGIYVVEASGLSVDDVGPYVLVSDTGSAEPAVSTSPATDVGPASVKLVSSVDGGPGSIYAVAFELSTAAGFTGSDTIVVGASPDRCGICAGPQDWSARLGDLLGNTRYYYRALVSTGVRVLTAPTVSFATAAPVAPTVVTDPATAVTSSGFTVNGRVAPNGAKTVTWFEVGRKSDLSDAVTSTPSDSATMTGAWAVVVTADAGTTYYFRIDAANSAGTSRGSILQVTTAAAPSADRSIDAPRLDRAPVSTTPTLSAPRGTPTSGPSRPARWPPKRRSAR